MKVNTFKVAAVTGLVLLGLGALLGKVATWPLRAYVINSVLAWLGHAPIDVELLTDSFARFDTLTAIAAIAAAKGVCMQSAHRPGR